MRSVATFLDRRGESAASSPPSTRTVEAFGLFTPLNRATLSYQRNLCELLPIFGPRCWPFSSRFQSGRAVCP